MRNEFFKSGPPFLCFVLAACSEPAPSQVALTNGPLGVVLASAASQLEEVTNLTIEQRAMGESPTIVNVKIILEDLSDDSVRGKKMYFDLSRDGDNWSIISTRVQYKCWSGRGHINYSADRCN